MDDPDAGLASGPVRDGGAPHERKGETMTASVKASSPGNDGSRAHHGSPSGLRRRMAGGLLRSARALAAAALLALCGGLALPATAQAEVLVSNIEEVWLTAHIGIQGISTLRRPLRTGRKRLAGFPLTSIEVKFLTVTIFTGSHGDGDGEKGANSSGRIPVQTTPPSSLRRTSFVIGNNTFTAPAGTRLAAE